MGRTSDARQRLLESGSRLIHASTCGEVSVDAICAAAGVNKGSFYCCFPAERDLALAVIAAQWAGARETLLEPAFAPDLPPVQRIVRLFSMAAAVHQARFVAGGRVLGCVFGNLTLKLGTREPLIRERLQAVFAGYRVCFEAAPREAQAAGSIAPQDIAATARALLAYFEGALLLAKTETDATAIMRLAEQVPALVGSCGSGADAASAPRNQARPSTGRAQGEER